ncbi:MAG: TspO/MBR family protein [Bacteroidota bacterium]
MRDFLVLLGFIALVALVAATGSRFEPGAWYAALDKPAWTPPNWLFPVAWSILYLLIAVSGWLVWREVGFEGASKAFTVYGLQLVLNAAWSWLFFGRHDMGLAFLDIAGLWLAIALTMGLFWAMKPLAGALLVPYLLWVTYAAALNLALWRMNPAA